MIEEATSEFPVIDNQLKLFVLNSSRAFGEQVSLRLALEPSLHEEREFEDGEHKARPLISVRGKNVFVIQSLYADHQQSGNDKLCRLLFFIGALKDAAAARVTAVVPYLAYARKDRKTKPRDPVTTRYVAALFEAVGTDAVMTLDVHNLAAFQNAFRCRTEHLEANMLFVEHFVPVLKDSEVVVVSPDAGGVKRAERLRQLLSHALGKPVGAAFAEKYRSLGVVSGDMVVGDVKGKNAHHRRRPDQHRHHNCSHRSRLSHAGGGQGVCSCDTRVVHGGRGSGFVGQRIGGDCCYRCRSAVQAEGWSRQSKINRPKQRSAVCQSDPSTSCLRLDHGVVGILIWVHSPPRQMLLGQLQVFFGPAAPFGRKPKGLFVEMPDSDCCAQTGATALIEVYERNVRPIV